MARTMINTLIDKRGRELAKWEGSKTPKNLRKTIKQAIELGGKVVEEFK